MIMPWYVSALLTAVCWGLLYVLAEQVTRGITKTSYLLICSVVQTAIYAGIAIGYNRLNDDMQFLRNSSVTSWSLVTVILVSLAANYLSLTAIQANNASMAAAVETTYPLWTVLFAYLLFGHVQLTGMGILGVFCVMSGIVLIASSSPPPQS